MDTFPYTPPEENGSELAVSNVSLKELPYKELKALYQHSVVIRILQIIIFIITCFCPILSVFMIMSYDVGLYIFFFFLFNTLLVFGCVGVCYRTEWGRVLGIMLSPLLLVLSIFGLVLWVYTVIAFIRRKEELFGENKVTHQEVRHAFMKAKLLIKIRKKAKP